MILQYDPSKEVLSLHSEVFVKYSSVTFSLLLLLGLSVLLVYSGIKMRPGIGIIGAMIVIPLVMWVRGSVPADIGLAWPTSWTSTILQALGWALAIMLLSGALIGPLSEILTRTTSDYGPVNKIKGNKLALIQMLVFVWVFVAIVEEVIFRGFFLAEIERVFGSSLAVSILSVVLTSVVFGLCHTYQNACGIVATGVIGALFAVVFLLSGRNLWLVILAHGFFDTIALFAIYFGYGDYLRKLFW